MLCSNFPVAIYFIYSTVYVSMLLSQFVPLSPSPDIFFLLCLLQGFPDGGSDKESACLGSVPGLGRSRGGGHGNPLQYSCLEKLMDRGAWLATVHGVSKSWTWLSNLAHTQAYHRVSWGSWLFILFGLPPHSNKAISQLLEINIVQSLADLGR